MNELSLFSGAGGGLLGTMLLGFRPIGYVEWDDYCQRVIAARIRDGILPDAPIFGDIKTFISEGYAASYTGLVDVITAGFPCQPFSVAGGQRGEDDPRNMWPQTIECIRIIRPRFAFMENVPGLLANRYIKRIFGDLAESGYDARWCCLSASQIGAPHIRERVWLLAYPAEKRWNVQDDSAPIKTTRECLPYQFKSGCGWKRETCGHSMERVGWSFESDIRGSDDAVAAGMDRLAAIGNGQVPAVVATAWRLLRG